MVMVQSVLSLQLVALQVSHDELTDLQESECHLGTWPSGYEEASHPGIQSDPGADLMGTGSRRCWESPI